MTHTRQTKRNTNLTLRLVVSLTLTGLAQTLSVGCSSDACLSARASSAEDAAPRAEDGECSGNSAPCFEYPGEYECNRARGCAWDYYFESCDGYEYECDDLTDGSDCIYARGCSWSSDGGDQEEDTDDASGDAPCEQEQSAGSPTPGGAGGSEGSPAPGGGAGGSEG